MAADEHWRTAIARQISRRFGIIYPNHVSHAQLTFIKKLAATHRTKQADERARTIQLISTVSPRMGKNFSAGARARYTSPVFQ